ncbi:MAG: hypothetical protein ACD_59C00053G0011 [uncultured bacterium]|nr:MAG: hypothetical protein ACD_59C00053G0011 [uncultured bacterium]
MREGRNEFFDNLMFFVVGASIITLLFLFQINSEREKKAFIQDMNGNLIYKITYQ